jgi:hypothetical protein
MHNLQEGIVDDRSSPSHQRDEYAPMVAKYGRPERDDDSTQYHASRPLIVTRLIEYRVENVRISFVPTGKFGDLPPYAKWKVIGYIDIKTNTKLSSVAVAERLKLRLR